MLRNKIFIYFVLLSSLLAKQFVVVLELDPIGLTKEEGRILTQRLSSEFINSRVYSVIALDKVKKILKENGYKNYDCTEKECAVEMGQIVNADFIVIGIVSKLGSTYNLDVKMTAGDYISTQKLMLVK